jgi:citrate lyase beta subunit
MKTTLNHESVQALMTPLHEANAQFSSRYPGETGNRQPVHVVYGGAHLFTAETVPKLGAIARRMLASYVPDASVLAHVFQIEEALAEQVFTRVTEKLSREPIEDLRIDFEDGYGFRPDAEEDAHAIAAAEQTAQAMIANALPPFFGLRLKAFTAELSERSIRTLDVFLTALCKRTNHRLPANFVITLPKVVIAEQVAALADCCAMLEAQLAMTPNSLQLELMVETPQSLVNTGGEMPLPKLIAAAKGRCRGVHFGAFDYTAAVGIIASHQDIRHPACDFARAMMQAAVSGTGVWLSDGVTTTLPLEIHRGELTPAQHAENQSAVHRAWQVHYDNIRHSLRSGFYQSWDLHPAQLIPRYAATYAFFLEGLSAATTRLRNFLDKAAQATTVGNTFDDAATGQGLLNYFVRAVHCGAMAQADAQTATGLTMAELRAASFVKILQNRRK